MMQWRPIEDAPRDTKTTVLLALQSGAVTMARRWSADHNVWHGLDGEADYRAPIHWMPLPKPPHTAERSTSHGHVRPRLDGVKARCGGPAICGECAREAAQMNGAKP